MAKKNKMPHVICHMMGSLDGRIQGQGWGYKNLSEFFEGPASKIKADAWIVGRRTMQEFSSKKPYRKLKGKFDSAKTDFVGKHKAKTFAVAIDPEGKCHWETNMTTTEHVIEVLTEKVSAEYLAQLREKQVSYIFAGKKELDLSVVLKKLRKLFGIKTVRIDGGGHVNGSFLKAGLIDEFSYVLMPVADGRTGALTVFERGEDDGRFKANRFKLKSVKKLKKDALWLRYVATKKS